MTAACPRFGFTVEIVPAASSAAERDSLRRAFVEFADANDLSFVGSPASWSFVLSREAGQAADSDRALVRAWADSRADIASARIGDLIDLRA